MIVIKSNTGKHRIEQAKANLEKVRAVYNRGPASIAECAEQTGLNKATVRRHVKVLIKDQEGK